ncbi:M64 family metallopeptidase [Saccharothrix australiensis]|uniref:IgA peptidase M64 n=1 Tax=Saccharothrix australiensis TaxID=2072 RepID=A0A495W8X5_9PSEU|nr:M64 family metallopeptidase [Saccharothrix australiensis]RKT57889.1 IgA peptidase M64 [Saccharothrix australiensis]
MRARRLTLPVLVAALVAATAPAPGGAAEPPVEWREVFSPDGTITRTAVPVAAGTAAVPSEVVADVVPIQRTGPSDQRFDLVFVGDGYTASELGAYHEHAVGKWNELAAVEPFKSYRQYFNVWRVDVVSRESGVDHDPVLGTAKDTALDMGFWCQGRDPSTERLLCVDQTKAGRFGALAPGADQVVALGNTAKYGGAGGGVATASGANEQAGQIVVHELGHSIGGLADEYDYPYDRYTGAEPSEPNATADPTGGKWSAYLGRVSPDGGTVGAYEGSRYYKRGLYRPTENSIMRTLGREFNLIGRDAMIAAFKEEIPELR